MARKTGAQIMTEAGVALYGDRWKRPLAVALGVDEKTIRRWLDDVGPTFGALEKMRTIMNERAAEIITAREALQRWLASV